jgi:hypothetical protein
MATAYPVASHGDTRAALRANAPRVGISYEEID